MNIKLIVVSLSLCVALGGCAITGGSGRIANRIVVERGGLIPEGIEFDTIGRRILTGSVAEGTVYEIANDGTLSPFVTDPELISSIGIEVDEPRNRLLVANSDSSIFGGTGAGIAKLGVYRLSNGEKIAMVDLGAIAGGDDDSVYLANDVTVDDRGNIYLTDTRMNLIYRVDTDYQASVFYRFEPITGLGLNGIVYHEGGYLIVVAVSTQGLLYRVPIDDPSAARPIDLSQPAIGADGLVWSADGRLIAVSNSTSSAQAFVSNDGWNSASLVGTAGFEGQATTGAAVDNEIYVVKPHFNDEDPPVIQRVDF